MNHFIVIASPTSQKIANHDSNLTTNKSEELSVDQSQVETNKALSRDTIRYDFKAGPISVSTNSKCSPIMDNCESYAVLHYRDQSLKIDSIGSEFHPLSEDEIAWVDNRYVTIYFGRGATVEGIEVAGLDDGKLFYLGKFSRIENGYLIKIYDVLYRALGARFYEASWPLYFGFTGSKAVLDMKETCLAAKSEYEVKKRELLLVLATPQKLDVKNDDGDWAEINVTVPLLKTLALARYCGWQNEYIEILKTAKSNTNNLVTRESLQEISTVLSMVEQPPFQQ